MVYGQVDQTLKAFDRFCISIKLSGRFAAIFYFNCEHFLSVYIGKQKQKSCEFYKKKS